MTETNEKVKLETKRVAKIALKTISNLFIGIMFTLMVVFFVAPSFSLKISKTFGSLKGQEVCCERMYVQSGNITDLYNLILINDQQNDYESELGYINQITKKSNYAEFCKSLDEASLEKITSKELIPYSCDVNAYLRRQKVLCLYNLGEDLTTEVIVQTASGSLSDISIAIYIDLINEDESLAEVKKTEKIVDLMKNKGIIVGGSFSKTDKILENRINSIKEELAKEDISLANEIILQYSLVKLYRAEYLISVYLDDEAAADKFKALYNSENAKLINLYN